MVQLDLICGSLPKSKHPWCPVSTNSFASIFHLAYSASNTSSAMAKLRPEYFSNIKRSVKMALERSPLSHNFKYRRWKENPNHHSPNHDVITANKAITFVCQTGDLKHARQMFDKMPERTVVSWNTMITGYSKWNMIPEALELISLMHHSNAKLNDATFSISLSVCGCAGELIIGKQIHGLVLKSGHQRFKLVGSALLYVYGSCCEIGDGRRVFDELSEENELLWSLMLMAFVECDLVSEAKRVFHRMPKRGVIDWTVLISGYVKSEHGCKKALEMFKMMMEDSEIVPNEFTLDCAIRGCGRLGDLTVGRMVHGLVIKFGFENECSISGALIGLYSNCEVMDDAKRIYDNLSNPLLNDSNELIEGLLKMGKIEEAELLFSNMAQRNPVSYNLMIKGYAMHGRIEDSKRLFMQMPEKILTSLNTMISVYAKNGEIDKALELFEKGKEEASPITWNSMISGYIQNDQHENALRLYQTMRRSSISQTRSTFSVLFHACACMGSLQQGQLLHAQLAKTRFSSDVQVGTALIDMYSKCGSIADSRAAFSCISSPNVAAWTALINGHAHHGLASDALSLFNLMLEKGITPHAATFVAVLSACARAGLVDKGMTYFRIMKECYHITPTLEHFTCVVDLLGRAGLLREAEEFIEQMPIEADKILLISLLHASWFWMDIEVGERVAKKMFSLDPNEPSARVIMSNMYSKSGKWGQKMKVRNVLKELRVKKDPGCSWIDVNSRVHVFSVDYRRHANSDVIYACVESLKMNAYSTDKYDSLSLHG